MQTVSSQLCKYHYRLLYRGSLSLPDSDLTLDGITFTAQLPSTSPSALLESPVALALESMRGRPSLRFISCVRLEGVPHEFAEGISMYIHPRSTLACEFFGNVLCAKRIGLSGHTTTAIRIGLGDGHGPEEHDLLVFGSLLPCQSTLRMAIARVIPPPTPSPGVRRPRPDDPNPRRPPTFELTERNVVENRRHSNQLLDLRQETRPVKRRKGDKSISLKTILAKDVMFRPPDLSANSKARTGGRNASMKVPGLRAGLYDDDDEVFGGSSSSKHAETLEDLNKKMVKLWAVKSLAVRGMPKEHPGFRELFGWVIRGVGFALRNKIRTVNLSNEEVQRLVDSHVLMYFDGFGGPDERG